MVSRVIAAYRLRTATPRLSYYRIEKYFVASFHGVTS